MALISSISPRKRRAGTFAGALTVLLLAGSAQAGLLGLCQLIANFDNPDIGQYYGPSAWSGGAVYVWGPTDYGLEWYRSQRISEFGVERNFRSRQTINDRIWEEAQRSSAAADRRSRDYQQNWIRRMTGTAPGWAVRPTPETRLETREPIQPIVTGRIDWQSGQIRWPNLLASPKFADLRGQVETQFARFCANEQTRPEDRTRLLQSLEALREELKGIGNQVTAHPFLVSLRFLDGFEQGVQNPQARSLTE